jgi:hypothetical protein
VLSEGDTKLIADEAMNRAPYETLLLGDITVYNREVPNGRNISADKFDRYKAWANTGLIKIVSQGISQRLQQMRQGQTFSWNDWAAQGSGIEERISVTPTCKSNEIC